MGKIVFGAIVLCACILVFLPYLMLLQDHQEISQQAEEQAVVAQAVYGPVRYGVFGQNLSAPMYAVVFKTVSGQNILVLDQKKAEDIYKKFKTGDSVLLKYRKVQDVATLFSHEWGRTDKPNEFVDIVRTVSKTARFSFPL